MVTVSDINLLVYLHPAVSCPTAMKRHAAIPLLSKTQKKAYRHASVVPMLPSLLLVRARLSLEKRTNDFAGAY